MSLIDVTVIPCAKSSRISGFDPWRKRVVVRVKAEARKNRANRELERYLSEVFGCKTEVVRGRKSRLKTVSVPLAKEKLYEQLPPNI